MVSPDLSDCDNQIPVRLGKSAGVSAVPEQDMALLIDKAQKSGVTSEVTLEPAVTAPVSRGQRLGTLTVKSGDLVLKEVPLVAAQEVERLSYGEIYRMVLMRAAMAKADAPEAAKFPKNVKSYLLFLPFRVYLSANRVGDLALSAIGTGSLPEGRRNVPRWGHRTRCCIWDNLLYVATILGRANGRGFKRCPSPRVICVCNLSPLSAKSRKGSFAYTIP